MTDVLEHIRHKLEAFRQTQGSAPTAMTLPAPCPCLRAGALAQAGRAAGRGIVLRGARMGPPARLDATQIATGCARPRAR